MKTTAQAWGDPTAAVLPFVGYAQVLFLLVSFYCAQLFVEKVLNWLANLYKNKNIDLSERKF